MRTIVTSVVVDYLNIDRPRFRPSETDSVLIVDPDAVLPSTVSTECLEAIAGWHSQVVQGLGLVKCVEPSGRHLPQRVGQPLASSLRIATIEQVFGCSITEAPDHRSHDSTDIMLTLRAAAGSQVGNQAVWTPVDGCGRRWAGRPCVATLLDGCGRWWTGRGDLRIRRSTGSSPSGRAAEIPCAARDSAYWPVSSMTSGPRLVRIWSARASLRTSSSAATRASMSDGKRCP